jgi:radical SAM protein with 4Fe4S-binding SPASM domain
MQTLIKKIFKTLKTFIHPAKFPEEYPTYLGSKNFKFDSVIHYLTLSCNSHCVTCNIWKLPQRYESNSLTLDNIKNLYSTLRAEEVYLTGGEPFLVPDFSRVCEIIHQCSGAHISFTTNGLATAKIKEGLIYLKRKKIPFGVSFSCNGFEKIHDFSRGIEGNYKKILDLIEFCNENSIRPALLYTIFPFNIEETIPFVKYWKKRGVGVSVSISRTDERYNLGEEYFQYTAFDQSAKNRLLKMLEELINIYPEYSDVYYLIKNLEEGRKIFPCFGLIKRIVIDFYGNVYPCDGLEEDLCLGNLRDVNFNFDRFCLQNQKRIKEIFETIREKRCQPCPYVCDLLYGISQTLPRKDKIKIIYSKIKQKMHHEG